VSEPFRSGFVGLAGRSNVGKSTLVNALTRSHVAIVSDKPQTTRQRILGVAHAPDVQLVLADLPGFKAAFASNASGIQLIASVDETEFSREPGLAEVLDKALGTQIWEPL
jgi:small GTP-binding protein